VPEFIVIFPLLDNDRINVAPKDITRAVIYMETDLSFGYFVSVRYICVGLRPVLPVWNTVIGIVFDIPDKGLQAL